MKYHVSLIQNVCDVRYMSFIKWILCYLYPQYKLYIIFLINYKLHGMLTSLLASYC